MPLITLRQQKPVAKQHRAQDDRATAVVAKTVPGVDKVQRQAHMDLRGVGWTRSSCDAQI